MAAPQRAIRGRTACPNNTAPDKQRMLMGQWVWLSSAGTYLRKNAVLKELWLAHNDLTAEDAYSIGNVLRSNFYLQFLDLSNNNIQVSEYIWHGFQSLPRSSAQHTQPQMVIIARFFLFCFSFCVFVCLCSILLGSLSLNKCVRCSVAVVWRDRIAVCCMFARLS